MIFNGNMTDLLKEIERIKSNKGISNSDMVAKTGKTKQQICNMLKGRQPNMRLESLKELCNAIDCDLVIEIKSKD